MIDRCYLEITNVCNLNCIFCPGHTRNPGQMSVPDFQKLTDSLKGRVRFLYFHLMGEPMLHPSLPQFVGIAREKGFVPVITTNGTVLPEAVAEASPYKINISLHSYEGNGGDAPSEYICKVADFARLALSKGTIVVLRLWNRDGYDGMNGQILDALRRHFPEPWATRPDGITLAEGLYVEYDSMFQWPDMGSEDIGEHLFCYALRNQIGVLVDGSVVPCCLDHNGDMALGNLFVQPLDEILSSDRARRIFDGFTSHTAVEPLCHRCGYAILTKRYHS